MRILIVVHSLPRYSLGGSEMCAARLAAELAPHHEVIVCAGRPAHASTLPRRERGPGYAIEWLDTGPCGPATRTAACQNAAIDAQFDDVMARVRPDVTHVHGVWGLSNNLPLIAASHASAVLFTLHDFRLMGPRGQHGTLVHGDRPPHMQAPAHVLRAPGEPDDDACVERYHAKSREIFEAVDLFVAPSPFIAREFERHGIAREKILHSEDGVDTRLAATCLPKSPGAIVRFGFLGSWLPAKGLHLLLDAFRGLTEDARLLVYGAVPSGDPGLYERDVRAAAVDRRITFPGRIEPRDVPAAFRAIDVLVVPSLCFENAPLTIREAFAAHTPVVASRCGGMAESVREGVDGLLFTPGSVEDLRVTLRRLLADHDLIAMLSRQAPAVKTMEQQATELEDVYYDVMRRAPRCRMERQTDFASHP